MDDQTLTEAFLARGLSRKTITVYLTMIRRARRSLDLDEVTASDLRHWAEETLASSRSSLAGARSALNAYWGATGRPDAPRSAIRVPRRRRMRCRALSEPQAAALARCARERAREATRKGLAVLLGLYGGLRRSEISELRWSDLTGDGWLRVCGKGSERIIPLHPVVIDALEVARRASIPPGAPRRLEAAERIFVGHRGGRLNPTTVWTWVKELGEEAGLAALQTHVLRHTALATALDGTRDLRAVQELAGHARPETTAGYTRATSKRLVGAVLAISYDA